MKINRKFTFTITLTAILILSCVFITSALTIKDNESADLISKETEFELYDTVGYGLDNYWYYLGTNDNYLYRENIENNKAELICDTSFNEIYRDKGLIYGVVNGKTLVCMDSLGNNIKEIYEDPDGMSNIFVNDDVLFYRNGNSIYRYYRTTEKLDLVFNSNDIEIENYFPKTNNVLVIQSECNDNNDHHIEEQCNTENELIQYNITTGVKSVFSESSTDQQGQTRLAATTINGKTIPHSSYPDGRYYKTTDTTTPCTCHRSGQSCIQPCTCKYFNNASQCMGFAYEIYSYIWNGLTTKTRYQSDFTFGDIAGMKKYMSCAGKGSHIRTQSHSFILVNQLNSDMDIYHANKINAPCKIFYENQSYSQFLGNHTFVNWIDVQSHVCTQMCYKREASGHTCIVKNQFTAHSGVCRICGWGMD